MEKLEVLPEKMRPLTNSSMKEPIKRLEVYETSFSVGMIKLYKGVISLAIFAFVACIFISIIKDFEKSTSTHCRVRNYLPSVSAAIGGFTLQKYIWQYMIALHCSPRLFFSYLARNYYLTFSTIRDSRSRYVLVHFMMVVEMIEVLTLLLLTIVSSSDAYAWHEKSFITFVVCSQVNMLLKIAIFVSLKHDPDFSNTMARSLSAKVKLWLINVSAIILAAYFFLRHNSYCEPGVYTLFALCEYTVVTTNILYHMTGFYEFTNSGATFWIGSYNKDKRKPS